jgi:hypothetical protein
METGQNPYAESARQYAIFRPSYPIELYRFLYEHLNHSDSAWDVGTGSGQVACALAGRFRQVTATDISAAQIAHAERRANIHYLVSSSEETPFLPESFDLVTAGMAVHWFDTEAFFREARRTGRHGALIAVWGYDLFEVGPHIDEIITSYHHDVLGAYWDYPRDLVNQRYQNLVFPFQEISVPSFEIRLEWTLTQIEGYLNTWSALRNYRRDKGHDPLPALMKSIASNWPAGTVREVRFPVFMRLGRIN